MPRAAATSALRELSRSGRPTTSQDRQNDRREHDDERDRGCADGKDRAEQNRDGGARGAVVGRDEVQQQGRQAEARAEHDPGREVAAAGPLHADQLHRAGGDGVDRDEAPDRADADEEGGRAAGRADVSEGLAREGLAADHGKDAEGAGDEGDQGTDSQSRVHGGVLEEAGREDRCRGRQPVAGGRSRDDLDFPGVLGLAELLGGGLPPPP